jgi:copper chaperone
MSRITVAIDGMSCSHCLTAVRRAVEGLDGAELEELKLGSAQVRYSPEKLSADRILEAIGDAGYEAHLTT